MLDTVPCRRAIFPSLPPFFPSLNTTTYSPPCLLNDNFPLPRTIPIEVLCDLTLPFQYRLQHRRSSQPNVPLDFHGSNLQ